MGAKIFFVGLNARASAGGENERGVGGGEKKSEASHEGPVEAIADVADGEENFHPHGGPIE